MAQANVRRGHRECQLSAPLHRQHPPVRLAADAARGPRVAGVPHHGFVRSPRDDRPRERHSGRAPLASRRRDCGSRPEEGRDPGRPDLQRLQRRHPRRPRGRLVRVRIAFLASLPQLVPPGWGELHHDAVAAVDDLRPGAPRSADECDRGQLIRPDVHAARWPRHRGLHDRRAEPGGGVRRDVGDVLPGGDLHHAPADKAPLRLRADSSGPGSRGGEGRWPPRSGWVQGPEGRHEVCGDGPGRPNARARQLPDRDRRDALHHAAGRVR